MHYFLVGHRINFWMTIFGSKIKMKVWVGKYKFLAFLTLVSSSLGVSGQDSRTTCDDVQDQFNSLKNYVEKLEKKVDDVAGYYMRNKVLSLEKEVERLKAQSLKIVPLTEKVQQLEAETQKVQTLTENVQELKSIDQMLIERMDEVTGNISAITEELQGLKVEDQEILQEQRNLITKLPMLWKSYEKSSFVKELVTCPKARLYSGTNFTGGFEDYTFETARYVGGCHDLTKLGNRVKSVDTFGKCVRLFYNWECQGRSIAVYPGSRNAENVWNPNLTRVNSIGPCLAEEFEDFDFKNGTKQIPVKNSSNPRKDFPDSVQFFSWEKENKGTSMSGSSFSLTKYLLGPGNRLEFLSAHIYPKHLKISQPEFEMQNTTDCRFVEKEPGDIVGYGILLSIGGPVHETYNAFQQTISAKSKWTELTSKIRPFLEVGGSEVFLGLNFAYEDEARRRPSGFYFWIGYWRAGLQKVSYGRVEN